MDILTIFGLALTTIGAFIIGSNDFVSKAKAVELGVIRIPGNNFEENLGLPAVKELLRRSHYSKIGLALVIVGYVFLLSGIVT